MQTSLETAAAKLRGLQGNLDLKATIAAKAEVTVRYGALFSPERVQSITEVDFRDFLLLKNNKHWGMLFFHGGIICRDMSLLRRALARLVDETKPLKERLDVLIPKGGPPLVPRLGRAVLTAILQVTYPDKYGVWNTTTEAGMQAIGAWPEFDQKPRLATDTSR